MQFTSALARATTSQSYALAICVWIRYFICMSSERLTITLSEQLAKRVRADAKRSAKSVSRVVADALAAQEQAHLREQLAADYRAAQDDETRRVTAELEGLDSEDWPT